MSLNISRLNSGGLITNYYCSSKCKHCLYSCSPKWPKKYISENIVKNNLKVIKERGCFSIHIGGGEPFLNIDGLKTVVDICKNEGVKIDYIETNSSWFKDEKSACSILRPLARNGISRLLISITPFHNEYIPFNKVLGVINACKKCNIDILPWIWDFYPEIFSFDTSTCHSLEEYKEKFGKNYVQQIPSRYWIHYGGRAIDTFGKFFPWKQYQDILNNNSSGCLELKDTSHFHIDLFGNYIPGLCSGLAIASNDLGKALSPDKYPVITTLYSKGIQGFFELAIDSYNFPT